MQTSRLSRRRQTVRPREVVLLSRGRPVNCWVVSDWMPTCSLSRSQCPVASGLWLLLLTQDVLLCCGGGVLSQECDTAKLHSTEAAIFASGCQHHLSTLSEVRTHRRSIVRRLPREREWGGRSVITVNTWPGLHTPIHGDTRHRWGSYWATSEYFKGHGTETLVLVFAITTFMLILCSSVQLKLYSIVHNLNINLLLV